MSSIASRRRRAVVGFLVWRGAKWYVRHTLRSKRAALARRLPARRTIVLVTVGGGSMILLAAAATRRLRG